MAAKKYDYLLKWVEGLRAKGRLSFTLEEAKKAFDVSPDALRLALIRLSKQGVIKSLVRGFYLYLPPEHRKRGVLPATMFVDDLMQFFQHKYYLALLSAASWHGAAHQAPQRTFVMTELPTLRPIQKGNLHIQFVHTRDFPKHGIDQKKVQTGYLQVSSPALTVLDLVKFEKKIGGLQRATEVIEELQELISPKQLLDIARQYSSTTALQRLGFILGNVLENQVLSNALEKALEKRKTYYQLLSTRESDTVQEDNPKWKIKVNTQLTTEF